MTDYTLHEGFPNLRIQEGMVIRLSAISPTTGLAITGVNASVWSIYGDDNSDTLLEDVVPVYSLDDDEDAITAPGEGNLGGPA